MNEAEEVVLVLAVKMDHHYVYPQVYVWVFVLFSLSNQACTQVDLCHTVGLAPLFVFMYVSCVIWTCMPVHTSTSIHASHT